MRWFRLDEEMLADELRVLLADQYGNVTIGTRDEDQYFDDYSQELHDIVYWAYIEKPCLMEPRITNDEWVTNAAKSDMIK